MAKKRRAKGPGRRPRKSTGRTGSSSTGRKARASSGADQSGEGRTLSINTTKDPKTMVSEAKKVARQNNATFSGNTTSGSFSGKGVKGRYKIEGNTVEVTITDKPTLASWSTVESKVKEFFR